jgi:hypothetical protein
MSRSFVGSLTGAGIGLLLGFVGVGVASGGESARDTGAIVLFVGSFLAGAGAIAGAVIGGVSDVRKLLHKQDETSEHETLK